MYVLSKSLRLGWACKIKLQYAMLLYFAKANVLEINQQLY